MFVIVYLDGFENPRQFFSFRAESVFEKADWLRQFRAGITKAHDDCKAVCDPSASSIARQASRELLTLCSPPSDRLDTSRRQRQRLSRTRRTSVAGEVRRNHSLHSRNGDRSFDGGMCEDMAETASLSLSNDFGTPVSAIELSGLGLGIGRAQSEDDVSLLPDVFFAPSQDARIDSRDASRLEQTADSPRSSSGSAIRDSMDPTGDADPSTSGQNLVPGMPSRQATSPLRVMKSATGIDPATAASLVAAGFARSVTLGPRSLGSDGRPSGGSMCDDPRGSVCGEARLLSIVDPRLSLSYGDGRSQGSFRGSITDSWPGTTLSTPRSSSARSSVDPTAVLPPAPPYPVALGRVRAETIKIQREQDGELRWPSSNPEPPAFQRTSVSESPARTPRGSSNELARTLNDLPSAVRKEAAMLGAGARRPSLFETGHIDERRTSVYDNTGVKIVAVQRPSVEAPPPAPLGTLRHKHSGNSLMAEGSIAGEGGYSEVGDDACMAECREDEGEDGEDQLSAATSGVPGDEWEWDMEGGAYHAHQPSSTSSRRSWQTSSSGRSRGQSILKRYSTKQNLQPGTDV